MPQFSNQVKLSPYHEIFYNEWRLNPERSDYNIVFDYEIFSNINPDQLRHALKRMSQDYYLLHSVIKEVMGTTYWFSKPSLCIELDYFPSSLSKEQLIAYVKKPFDLENGPLLRVALIKFTNNFCRLITVFHHLIMDSSKSDFVYQTIPKYYDQNTYQFEVSIPDQMQKLTELGKNLEGVINQNEGAHKIFWDSQLLDLNGPDLRFLKFSKKYPAAKSSQANIGEYLFHCDEGFSHQLKLVQKKISITSYLYSQVVFALTVHRYTDQEKFGICYMVSIHEGANFIYGTHVNPCFVPYEFSKDKNILDIFENVKIFMKKVKAGKHQYYPIQRILPKYVQNNLLAVGFSQTDLKNEFMKFDGLPEQNINTELNMDCSGELLFSQELVNNQLNFRVLFNKDCIDKKLLINFIETYKCLLVQITEDLLNNKGIESLSDYPNSILPKGFQNLIFEINNTKAIYQKNKTIHQLFESQVEKTPGNIALVCEETQLTYRELNERANMLANQIISQYHPRADEVVLLFLDRNQLTIIAQLAVLKSGCAYVPLDVSFPNFRIHQIINDMQSKIIITNSHHHQRLSSLISQKQSILSFDTHSFSSQLNIFFSHNPVTATSSKNLAYVINTSGTTGKPKGVMIEHQSVINLVLMQTNTFSLLPKTNKTYFRCLGFSNYVFDAHVWEYFATLLNGHCLYLVSETVKQDIRLLQKYIQSNQIDIATLPPILLDKTHILPLKTLIVAGEKTEWSIIEAYLQNGVQITNAYGPSEATVCATVHQYGNGDIANDIGKPIANTSIYILDRHQRPMPMMAIGELHIAGEGLSRGYLNEPELTNEVFLPNPFCNKNGKRHCARKKMYKTGDLARWMPDGSIEYIGRIDDQIKIAGCRIELREIEINLLTYPGIEKCVALQMESNDKYLVVYFVAQSDLDVQRIHGYLAARLPSFMLPKSIIQLTALPLNLNGKLDKAALPKPSYQSHQDRTPPSSELEYRVCAMFAKVLGLQDFQVGIHTDFFNLGGDSISAIRLAANLRPYFNINVRDIFELKTPFKLIHSVPLTKVDLYKQLSRIKDVYENTVTFASIDWNNIFNPALEKKYANYLDEIRKIKNKYTKKNIKGILLTGSTGHLGCHLLNELLHKTPYHIYLPVRSEATDSAVSKLFGKYRYYFDQELADFQSRFTVFKANIEKTNLDISDAQYQDLISRVDSVIHCAALIKHYGCYEEFYQANVQTTINLLELTKQSSGKDFHYISTVSVLLWGYIPGEKEYLFTENDDPSIFVRGSNYYIQTKFQSEILVRQYREQGVNGNIYRVGNLCMNSQNYRTRENYEENMFFNHFKSMKELGMIPIEISQLELSPVDCTASAIVKLFDKVELSNQAHHVFNPNTCNLIEMLNDLHFGEIRKANLTEFIINILDNLSVNVENNKPHFFIIYQMWLQALVGNASNSTKIKITQNKTEHNLKNLNFEWIKSNSAMFYDVFKKAKINSVDNKKKKFNFFQ